MSGNRHDAVWIRCSTDQQEKDAQCGNVKNMLRRLEKHVDDKWWFASTVSRSKVTSDAEFKRLIELVKLGEIHTIYIETGTRLGMTKPGEYFTLKELLVEYDTKLFDLSNQRELTDDDVAADLNGLLGIRGNLKDLQDRATFSLRTRVDNFKNRQSWPNGSHPFGFGKECRDGDKLLWVFQPVSRSLGQLFYPNEAGKLMPGPKDTKIPQKKNYMQTTLVPSNNKEHIKTVKLIFDLYTRAGLSRRAISARLNAEGRRFYDQPFTHSLVTLVLQNAAYVGDTHFGKTQSGEYRTFDADGIIVKADTKVPFKQRPVSEQIICRDTHTGLITRATWEATVAKMAAERERTTYSSINPAYYLKQLFVCGHCGKNMVGRTDNDPKTKKKTIYYVCSSYQLGRTAGQTDKCGYHRITHAAAEQLLLAKMEELNLQYEESVSEGVRTNLKARLKMLHRRFKHFEDEWQQTIDDGVNALVDYLGESLQLEYPKIIRFRRRVHEFYWGDEMSEEAFKAFGLTLEQFAAVVRQAEAAAVEEATKKVKELEAKHKRYTEAWVEGTEEQRPHIKAKSAELEEELKRWRPRTKPITEQLDDLYSDELKRQAERKALLDEWPTLEGRERGEAFRRIFKTVELYWDAEFRPAADRPTRERKTDRPGRYSYTLNEGKIRWAYAPSILGGSW